MISSQKAHPGAVGQESIASTEAKLVPSTRKLCPQVQHHCELHKPQCASTHTVACIDKTQSSIVQCPYCKRVVLSNTFDTYVDNEQTTAAST